VAHRAHISGDPHTIAEAQRRVPMEHDLDSSGCRYSSSETAAKMMRGRQWRQPAGEDGAGDDGVIPRCHNVKVMSSESELQGS
jgi:hypothetical protein